MRLSFNPTSLTDEAMKKNLFFTEKVKAKEREKERGKTLDDVIDQIQFSRSLISFVVYLLINLRLSPPLFHDLDASLHAGQICYLDACQDAYQNDFPDSCPNVCLNACPQAHLNIHKEAYQHA